MIRIPVLLSPPSITRTLVRAVISVTAVSFLLAANHGEVARAMPGDVSAVPPDLSQTSWQEVPLEGATCGGPPNADTGDRAQYSYFINPSDDPEAGVLFLLSGGGACMKEGHAPAGVSGIAQQLHCMDYGNFADPFFNATTFSTDAVSLLMPYIRRNDADNPFRDFTYVAVPYCTGDVHAGRMTEPYDYDPAPDATFEVVHRGHLNVMAVLDDVSARYPGDVPVVLTGFSAGGFGSILNFPFVIERWPRTTLIPDAGIAPPHPDSLMAREGQRVADRWGARALLPDYCDTGDCLADTLRLLSAHAAAYDGRDGRPWRAFGFLQAQQDGVLSDYLEISRCSYQVGLMAGMTERGPNLRGYVPATDQHVFGIVNPFEGPYTSKRGVDPFGWVNTVATATSEEDLPPDAIDGWLPCNPAFVPKAW